MNGPWIGWDKGSHPFWDVIVTVPVEPGIDTLLTGMCFGWVSRVICNSQEWEEFQFHPIWRAGVQGHPRGAACMDFAEGKPGHWPLWQRLSCFHIHFPLSSPTTLFSYPTLLPHRTTCCSLLCLASVPMLMLFLLSTMTFLLFTWKSPTRYLIQFNSCFFCGASAKCTPPHSSDLPSAGSPVALRTRPYCSLYHFVLSPVLHCESEVLFILELPGTDLVWGMW